MILVSTHTKTCFQCHLGKQNHGDCQLEWTTFQMNLSIKGERHPKMRLSMFCVLFQNYQHIFRKNNDYLEANCLRNSKNGIKISVCKAVLELLINMLNTALINKLKNRLAYYNITMQYLNFSDNLLQDNRVLFQKCVDNFDIQDIPSSISVCGGLSSLQDLLKMFSSSTKLMALLMWPEAAQMGRKGMRDLPPPPPVGVFPSQKPQKWHNQPFSML